MTNDVNNFDDASSSALLAATVYRLALLTGNKMHVREAERTRAALFAANGTSANTSGVPVVTLQSSSTGSAPGSTSTSPPSDLFVDTPHFTADGWLAPVVDPLDFAVQGAQSPEGQAFTLMLHSAWRDWSAAGSPGANVALPGARVGRTVVLGIVGLVVAHGALFLI